MMRLFRFGMLACATLAIACAQDGLVASATRLVVLPPTEAVVQVSVRAESPKTLNDVLNKVKEVGLTLENLATIITTPAVDTGIPGLPVVAASSTYSFGLSVPISEATGVMQRIQQFAGANPEFRMDAGVAGVSPSLAAVQAAQQGAFPELFKEAKARAEEMARSAGLSPGRVLAVSDTYQYTTLAGYYTSVQVPLSVAVRLAID